MKLADFRLLEVEGLRLFELMSLIEDSTGQLLENKTLSLTSILNSGG